MARTGRWAGAWIGAMAAGGCVLPDDDFDHDGWSIAAGDCDDFDAGVHPTANEVDRDGVDADCDGFDPIQEVRGRVHWCFLASTGNILCEGDNTYGQLDAPATGEFVEIAAGDFHTCALDVVGSVVCWGDNEYGQADPPRVPMVNIAAAGNWSLGERWDGAAICWGQCFAQMLARP